MGIPNFESNKGARERALLVQTKKEGNVIYGAQSIKKQLGAFGRNTVDFDIYSNNPLSSARKTEKTFDKIHGKNDFFVKKAAYPKTKKVVYKGADGIRGTKDDISVIDYTKANKMPKSRSIGGVKFAVLSHSVQTKKKALRDPSVKFRHAKDREDIQRIKFWEGRI